MTSSDQKYSAEERFERRLIDSARSDELPSDVEAAWRKFSAALNEVSLLAEGPGSALAIRRARRWVAAKWLICGVMTGSALTALGLRPTHDRRTEPRAAPSAPIAISAVASAVPTSAIETEAPPRTAAPLTALQAPHSARPRPPASRGEAAPAPGSTLSAQVALLDAARTALSAGSIAEALRLADRYHRDFPNGELAPEAEVVAIEALTERGDRQAAVERAARFIARFPGDPHTARVKWLVR